MIPTSILAETFEARINQLGLEGDGVYRSGAAPIHVSLSLPGEVVLAEMAGHNRAIARSVLTASPDRVEPPCGLFGACGGCVLQHQGLTASLAWKQAGVETALKSAGFVLPATVDTVQSKPFTRRRMDLALRRGPDGLLLVGLHRRGSEAVVDLVECHVLEPALFALLGRLRVVLGRVQGLRKTGSLVVNLLDSGADLLLATDGKLVSRDRAILAEFAAEIGIPRIAWQSEDGGSAPEIVSLRGAVRHRLAGIVVQPPAGAFLQATASGEAAIVDAVVRGLPGKKTRNTRIVELYAGCGTISFALSAHGRVDAYEGHADSATALRVAGAAHRISAQARDLNRQPLLARDFAGFSAIVLDPPHAGAGAQMREVAGSLVPCVVYVSCNPTTLAADTAMLAKAGYHLAALTVIDQFLWSARIEAVCIFTKPVVVRRGPLARPNR